MLTSSGILNTFGTPADYSNIIITPYCFKKGSTSVAIYGLSHFHSSNDLLKLIGKGGLTFDDVDERTGFISWTGTQPPDDWTGQVRESLTSDFKFVKILLVHQKFSPRLRDCLIGKMAFDLIIWGYQSNYESISANDIQPGHCAFFDFENEKDEETKSIQILKLKGKKFQLERQTLKSTRKVSFSDGNPYTWTLQ